MRERNICEAHGNARGIGPGGLLALSESNHARLTLMSHIWAYVQSVLAYLVGKHKANCLGSPKGYQSQEVSFPGGQ